VPDFRTALKDGSLYFFDGGYGTLLMARGLPAGMSPELWGLEKPEIIRAAHADYLAAGARILTTNTFGGSGPKLGLGVDVEDFNRRTALIAREVAGDKAFVAGSVGPTGLFVRPLGPLTFRELVDIFTVQIRGLVAGGCDLIKAETHFDLAEAKAVVVAAREVCDLPVLISMTFEGEASLTGTPPVTFVDTMRNLGVEVVGVNCSAGPAEMLATVRAMRERLDGPLHVQPNAGLPELVDGRTVFRLGPDDFAAKAALLAAEPGVKFAGGCCGTTPDHIRALAGALQGRGYVPNEPSRPALTVLTSRAQSVPLGLGHRAVCIGERINPTGKERLTRELQAGDFTYAQMLAHEQAELGAALLDVNVGAPMVKEEELLPALSGALLSRFPLPLCLDSNKISAIEASLWDYPGSPLVNSISGEPGRLEELGPLCARLGAPFILLPLEGRKLPETAAERIQIIESLLAKAESLGVPRRLAVVDALVLTVSSKPEAALACLDVVRWCTRNGLATTMGLSNISFGLPARELVNTTFLSMGLAMGLSSFIANPSSARLREALAASEVLLARDAQAAGFIAGYAGWKPSEGGGGSAAGGGKTRDAETPRQAVIAGARDAVVGLVEADLARGRDPFEIVREELVPGIMEVGEKYERKEYYLPQLLLSAETMQKAMARLEPLLEQEQAAAARPKIVMATVEGDIHDIGKNIVCLMLRNHGFEVVDLGKDVPARVIVDAAKEHGARIIGLSALMTTTMVRMEDTVKLVREEGLPVKVMIGGAVVTEAFCAGIGADGSSTDAVSAVRLAKRLAG